MESAQTETLTSIEGWPYQEIAASFDEFRPYITMFQQWYDHCRVPVKQANGPRIQPVLFVGRALWSLLERASDSRTFFVCEIIPILRDTSNILEPHEFMFYYQEVNDK